MAFIRRRPFVESYNDQQRGFERSFGYPGGYRPSSEEVNKMRSQLWRNSITGEGGGSDRSAAESQATGVVEQKSPFQTQAEAQKEEKMKRLKEMGLL